ncbi:MAG: MBL fold metallo-hydrolase [Desulfobacteraceae bacterium]|nr:MBL fold metallo-hydrolase [Desulfobacteraceae bacterium]
MKTLKKHNFGDVLAYELGFSPIGHPLMTVNCFIVGHILIDTGQSHMQKTVLDFSRAHQIRAALLTHHHEDHSGNAAAIKQILNIPVMAHSLTINKVKQSYRIFPYQHWVWGPTTPVELNPFPSDFYEHENLKFQLIHAPGHSKDHTVFLEVNNGWLFSGDLYLGDRIKYFRADEKIGDQIVSLKNVLTYDFDALFCSHNPRPQNGKKHLAAKLQFLEDFYGQVSFLADQGLDEKKIMRQLHLKEQQMIKLICFGNVSMRNMVRSVISDYQE